MTNGQWPMAHQKWLGVLGLLGLFLPLSVAAWSGDSGGNGTLSITVLDSFDTPVANASIKAMRIRDSKRFETRTNAGGTCRLALPVGTYGLTVRAANFKPDFTGGVVVRRDTVFPLRFSLYPGDPNEKLPQEKAPEERAAELARMQAEKGKEANTTVATVLEKTYKGLDEALKVCKIKRTKEGPAVRAAWAAAAFEQVRQGQPEKALAQFKRAIGADPSDPWTWFNCGALFLRQRQSRPAETCFHTAIGLCGGGGDSIFHAYLGRALGRQGLLKEAAKCYAAATIINPAKKGQYKYELGNAYHSMRQPKKAEALFAEAIALKYDDPNLHFAYANALELNGKNRAARKEYQVFLRKAGKNPALLFYVDKAREKLKRLGRAADAEK